MYKKIRKYKWELLIVTSCIILTLTNIYMQEIQRETFELTESKNEHLSFMLYNFQNSIKAQQFAILAELQSDSDSVRDFIAKSEFLTKKSDELFDEFNRISEEIDQKQNVLNYWGTISILLASLILIFNVLAIKNK